MERTTVESGTAWERSVGYARAIRTGPLINVSGTTATDDTGEIVGVDDAGMQTIQAIDNIESALGALDATLADVVRTRMFVTDIDALEAVGTAHCDRFGEIQPATTMVEVAALVDPAMLVEIEAVAYVDDPSC